MPWLQPFGPNLKPKSCAAVIKQTLQGECMHARIGFLKPHRTESREPRARLHSTQDACMHASMGSSTFLKGVIIVDSALALPSLYGWEKIVAI
jgi:hypothetical protein